MDWMNNEGKQEFLYYKKKGELVVTPTEEH